MSLLQSVFEKYGVSENHRTPTAKTAESPFGSSGSEWLEDLKKHDDPCCREIAEITLMRLRGVVPDHYTASTECRHCGPVPIWKGCPPTVRGCPWCFNRHAGQPTPAANRAGSGKDSFENWAKQE